MEAIKASAAPAPFTVAEHANYQDGYRHGHLDARMGKRAEATAWASPRAYYSEGYRAGYIAARRGK